MIFFFVKYFEKQRYADEFVAGKLFCNRVSKFKESSDSNESGRSDEHEGTWLVGPDGKLDLVNSEGMLISITPRDLAGPIRIQKTWLNHRHLFCMCAGHTGDLDHDALDDINVLREQLIIPDECSNFGNYAVLVNNVDEFVKRMERAAQNLGYGFGYGLVKYYDPDSFHGWWAEEESIFRKQNQYKNQREFRFVIDSHTMVDNPVVLELGDLSDITWRFDASELKGGDWVKSLAWT